MIDKSDHSIISGYFRGTANFGSITLTSAGKYDIFIAKYDAMGNVNWAKRAGGEGDDFGNGIATDESGNSIVTGYFNDVAFFGTQMLTSAGGRDIFISKHDASGDVVWSKRAGGTGDDEGYRITANIDGNSPITGYFHETASFDAVMLTSAGDKDIFIANYDPAGNVVWAIGAGGFLGNDEGYGIATNELNDNIVTGHFGYTATFGSKTLTSTGGYDIFIAHLGTGEPFFTITSPNGGENWLVGSRQPITWTWAGAIDNVKLEYSTDKGTNWTEIIASTLNDGEYEWIIPPIPSFDCLVKISDAMDGDPQDVSDEPFTIMPGTVTQIIPITHGKLNMISFNI